MKKQILAGLASGAMFLAMTGTAAATPQHDEHSHGHLKIIGLQERDGMVQYRKCIELPVVPLHAHHEHKHIGGAHGPNQVVIPTYAFESCQQLAVVLGPPGVWFPAPD